MNEATASLAEIDRQRAALADRVRLPLWYRVLWAFALLGLFVVPLLFRMWSSSAVYLAVQGPAIVVLSLANVVLNRATGAQLSRKTLRAYPSSRWPGVGMIAAVVVGAIVEWVLVAVGLTGFGVLAGILAVTATTVCLDQHVAGIRADIRDGNVVPV